ncbi:MAG: type II toxin-antitoxin system RelE/ParE family toxin [Terriglobia bacterium]
MAEPYRVLTTSAFERQARKVIGRNKKLVAFLEDLLAILVKDPQNTSRKYQIKKLTGLNPGEGQWRIRRGDYRLRYDIFEKDVVLHSFRDRKKAYRA